MTTSWKYCSFEMSAGHLVMHITGKFIIFRDKT